MSIDILSVASATPSYTLYQKEVGKIMGQKLLLEEKKREKLLKIYEQSAIEKRHCIVEDFLGDKGSRFFQLGSLPKMEERNAIFIKEALPLALTAAKKAIDRAELRSDEITHVISVTCTGIFAPGLEFSLIKQLELSPYVERLGINFMGCFGAFRALAAAAAIASESDQNKVLIVCTELCSLHFQPYDDWDNLIANALFSDGAAAAIVGKDKKRSLFSIQRKKALSLPNSFDAMQWRAGNEGMIMKLSAKVPPHIKKAVKNFMSHLLAEDTQIEEADFPLHPGGKAIIEQIEKELSLSREQTSSSWNILKNHGNMSSATFLFVLEELLKKEKNRREKWAVGLGFGPGLSLEGILLKQCG